MSFLCVLECSISGEKKKCANRMDVIISPFVSDNDSWGYIRIPPQSVKTFIGKFKTAVESARDDGFFPSCFIHETTVLTLPKGSKGPVPQKEITPIGIVFLQGDLEKTKDFLMKYTRNHFLVKDKTTGSTACIPAAQMNLFRSVLEVEPERVTYLDNPISSFKGRRRIKMLSGILKGQTGYLVRYRKDRKLVVGLAGMTVAFGGIHNDTFQFLD